MKRFLKLFFVTSLSALFMGGCAKVQKEAVFRVVTGVEISCQKEDVQIFRSYTDTEKMEYVLLYLRLLKPLGRPTVDPTTVDADIYEITLQLSDGARKVYRQKDHRYLSADSGFWLTIDPAQAEGLYRLMRNIPGDKI